MQAWQRIWRAPMTIHWGSGIPAFAQRPCEAPGRTRVGVAEQMMIRLPMSGGSRGLALRPAGVPP